MYGKRGTYSGWWGLTYNVDVGLKVNGTAQGTTTGDVASPSNRTFVKLGTYTVPNDLTGLVNISLQYFTPESGSGSALITYYVTITTD